MKKSKLKLNKKTVKLLELSANDVKGVNGAGECDDGTQNGTCCTIHQNCTHMACCTELG